MDYRFSYKGLALSRGGRMFKNVIVEEVLEEGETPQSDVTEEPHDPNEAPF
jgi:hypothetical protein